MQYIVCPCLCSKIAALCIFLCDIHSSKMDVSTAMNALLALQEEARVTQAASVEPPAAAVSVLPAAAVSALPATEVAPAPVLEEKKEEKKPAALKPTVSKTHKALALGPTPPARGSAAGTTGVQKVLKPIRSMNAQLAVVQYRHACMKHKQLAHGKETGVASQTVLSAPPWVKVRFEVTYDNIPSA